MHGRHLFYTMDWKRNPLPSPTSPIEPAEMSRRGYRNKTVKTKQKSASMFLLRRSRRAFESLGQACRGDSPIPSSLFCSVKICHAYLVVVLYQVYLVVVLLCTFDIMGDLVYGAPPYPVLTWWLHLDGFT